MPSVYTPKTMLDLWTRLRKINDLPFPLDYDLWERRKKEIDAELPVPFCCPKAAGVRTVGACLVGETPRWETIRRAEVSFCPFCGTRLPEFQLKANPPAHVYAPAPEDDCAVCGDEIECTCSPRITLWEAKNAPPVTAATALVVQPHKVLSVSRKNDPAALGLPGGKIEPGESPAEAMKRELLEETGLQALDYNLIFDAMDTHGNRTQCFIVTEASGSIKTQEAGRVQWVTPEELATNSPFKDYNWSLLKLLNVIVER